MSLHEAVETGNMGQVKAHVFWGTEIDLPDAERRTPLHLAVVGRHLQIARLLLDNGANADARDNELDPVFYLDRGLSVLHYAARRDATGAWTELIAEHATSVDPRTRRKERTPLHQAVRFDRTESAKVLLKRGADVEARDEDGMTPLHYAAQLGHVEAARVLLHFDADPDSGAAGGESPLVMLSYEASRSPGDPPRAVLSAAEFARLLLQAGADPDARKMDGATPLESAVRLLGRDEDDQVRQRRLEFIDVLLGAGASVLIPCEHGCTALHHAADHGDPTLTTKILEAGADVHARTKGRKTTALHWASSRGVIEALLGHGAEIDALDAADRTPLLDQLRSPSPDLECMRALLENGADVNAETGRSNTALHIAAEKQHLDAVLDLLLEFGADVNALNLDRETPLHIAARQDDHSLVDWLLEHGAKVNVENWEGETPLGVVSPGSYAETLIKRAGGKR